MKKRRGMVCLNLGSGPNSVKGWVNYDWGWLPILGSLGVNGWLGKLGILDKEYGVRWPEINLCDIRKGLPDRDISVDYIYCSHVLEHFERYETEFILKECKRVLKIEGILRIVLPDLEIIKKISDPDDFNRKYFGFDKDKFRGILEKFKVKFIRAHQWMYNFESFSKLLREAGFSKIEKVKMGVGVVPDLRKLDLAIHEELSFYVEASN